MQNGPDILGGAFDGAAQADLLTRFYGDFKKEAEALSARLVPTSEMTAFVDVSERGNRDVAVSISIANNLGQNRILHMWVLSERFCEPERLQLLAIRGPDKEDFQQRGPEIYGIVIFDGTPRDDLSNSIGVCTQSESLRVFMGRQIAGAMPRQIAYATSIEAKPVQTQPHLEGQAPS